MVEVFKTDVKDQEHAMLLVEMIHNNFPGYKANFDLSDCDNILRIQAASAPIETYQLITLLNEFGFSAEVLPDKIPAVNQLCKYALFRKPVYL